MSLEEHARRELVLCGQYAEDEEYSESLIAAVREFSSYGHSGGSASVAVEMLHRLLQYKTLSPITSSPDEWHDVSGMSGVPMWQNTRDPSVFSDNGGETWYESTDPVRKQLEVAGWTYVADTKDCVLLHNGTSATTITGTGKVFVRNEVDR